MAAQHRSGPGVLSGPNIWQHTEVYERENAAQDVSGALWAALATRADWTGADLLDVGCGDGYHLPRFATVARTVIGVEPHAPLVARARRRVAALSNVRVLDGAAQRIPLPDASVDVVHARTAYFFGPGCEPGLVEADRVLRPGGVLAIVDLDGAAPPYGDWLCAGAPRYRPAEVDRFFAERGFTCDRVATTWRFASRTDLAAVLNIEFPPAVAVAAFAATPGVDVPVGYRVLTRRRPIGLDTSLASEVRQG